MGQLIVAAVLAIFAMIIISKIVRVVPQQQAWVVERLGKFHETLGAGLHILWPFLDTVRYKHSLKEIALDVPEQVCITKDNTAARRSPPACTALPAGARSYRRQG